MGEFVAPPATFLNANDKQCRNLTFFQAPLIHRTQIDFNHRDPDNEISDISLVRLAKDRKSLVNMKGEATKLCFPLHEKYVVKYLQKHTPKTLFGIAMQQLAFSSNRVWQRLGEKSRSSLPWIFPQKSVAAP
jgi:hypothetical protein